MLIEVCRENDKEKQKVISANEAAGYITFPAKLVTPKGEDARPFLAVSENGDRVVVEVLNDPMYVRTVETTISSGYYEF